MSLPADELYAVIGPELWWAKSVAQYFGRMIDKGEFKKWKKPHVMDELTLQIGSFLLLFDTDIPDWEAVGYGPGHVGFRRRSGIWRWFSSKEFIDGVYIGDTRRRGYDSVAKALYALVNALITGHFHKAERNADEKHGYVRFEE